MSSTATVQMSKRGVLTLPKALRDRYGLRDGDPVTVLDLGGAILLRPGRAEVDALADRLAQQLQQKGESLDSMMKVLREEREHHGKSGPAVR